MMMGKTTFLNCISGLEGNFTGTVDYDGFKLDRASDEELSEFRNTNLGFVFQFHYLLKDFNILENVMMPCLIAGISNKLAIL